MMEAETIVQILTLVLTFLGGIITLLVRARLIEQGKDIENLKAQMHTRGQDTSHQGD